MFRVEMINCYQALAGVTEFYFSDVKQITNRINVIKFHKEVLAGRTWGRWRMDQAAADYRIQHKKDGQLAILSEMRGVAMGILRLNSIAKNDPAIAGSFLGRRYDVKKDLKDLHQAKELAAQYKEIIALVNDFETLLDEAAEWRMSLSQEVRKEGT